MSKMFGNLNADGLEAEGDRLGGGSLLDTAIYDATVKLAFVGKASASNAQSITVHLDINGIEFRDTFWVTNRNGENFYPDKKDPSKKRPLPGFTMVDDLALLTTGLPLSELDVEEKVVRLYDYTLKKEIPQNVLVIVDMLGKPVTVAVIKQIVDKQQKDTSGVYQNTGETREENVADKFFHTESRRTVTEVREGMEEAVFYSKWAEKNNGKVINRAKGAEGRTGAPARPTAGAPAAAKKKSLFG